MCYQDAMREKLVGAQSPELSGQPHIGNEVAAKIVVRVVKFKVNARKLRRFTFYMYCYHIPSWAGVIPDGCANE